MAREGVPANHVAKYMGHKHAAITLMIYTHPLGLRRRHRH